jgi:predicted RNase H-like nuclease
LQGKLWSFVWRICGTQPPAVVIKEPHLVSRLREPDAFMVEEDTLVERVDEGLGVLRDNAGRRYL